MDRLIVQFLLRCALFFFYLGVCTLGLFLLLHPEIHLLLEGSIATLFFCCTLGLFILFVLPYHWMQHYIASLNSAYWLTGMTSFRGVQLIALTRALFYSDNVFTKLLEPFFPSPWGMAGYTLFFVIIHTLAYLQVKMTLARQESDPVFLKHLAKAMRDATLGTCIGMGVILLNGCFFYFSGRVKDPMIFFQTLYLSAITWYFPLLAKVLRTSFAARRALL